MTTRRLAAILAADVAGYTGLMGVDEVATLQERMGAELLWIMVSIPAAQVGTRPGRVLMTIARRVAP